MCYFAAAPRFGCKPGRAYAHLAAASSGAARGRRSLELLAISAYLTGADHASIDVWVRA